MNKVDEIKSQLAQRLEKQASSSARVSQQPDADDINTQHNSGPQPAITEPLISKDRREDQQTTALTKNTVKKISKVSPSAVTNERVIKLSASLYSYDLDCLDRIREFMRTHGVRNLTDSEALRLACRAVKIDDQFLSIYQDMSKEDGRRRKD